MLWRALALVIPFASVVATASAPPWPSIHEPRIKLASSAAAWRSDLLGSSIRAAFHHEDHRLLQEVGSGVGTTPDADVASVCVTQGFVQCLGPAIGFCLAGVLPVGACAQVVAMTDNMTCALISIIETHTAALGAPFITSANCVAALGSPAHSLQRWTVEQVGVWAYLASPQLELPSTTMYTFTANHINGVVLRSIEEAEMRAMGFTVGEARSFVETRDNYFVKAALLAPSQVMSTTSMEVELGPSGPTPVSITFNLLKLNDIDQSSFAFEVEFDLMVSWEDDTIDSKCDGAGADGGSILQSDVCSSFWKPSFLWTNAIGEVNYIQDGGLTTLPGAQSTAESSEVTPGVNHSIGFTNHRVVGKFQGLSLSYQRFPYDTQELTVMLRAPSLYPNSTVNFVGMAGMAAAGSIAEPADWKVDSIGVTTTQAKWTLPEHLQNNTNDPFLSWARAIPGFSFESSTPSFSQLNIKMKVSRLSSYMLWNFVILISLLVWLSFLTFFLARDAIDVRLSVALTVILAINVYQIVLVDMMPATGYLTDMHAFALAETVLVIFVAIEK